MSQHRFSNISCFVFCGWDRPSQSYFCFIEDNSEADLFNHERLDNPYPKDFTIYLEVFFTMGIKIPENLIANLELDKANDVGAEITNYGMIC